MKKIALTLTMLLGTLSASNATAFDGDAEAGKAKSATCAACHGPDGNAPVTMYPKIAGQHADYIYKQLQEFKLGMTSGGSEGRMDPVMSGMAMPLSDQDMKDLAAYFSTLNMSEGTTPEDVVAAGQKLYKAGDAERGIPSCAACHGPRGNGTSLAKFPKISFQHPEYIKSQLLKFRDGTRKNDLNGMMQDIAKKLTDKDIETLSKYLGGLH
ncbi:MULTISPECIES: c-type cytochrome [Pseudoalteromonas]|uniref:Cytochrome C n=1 Tax=Pseudoalteromonas amylolytica TaxID=1859457 RepID=A0A1S1MTL1_9GAMM|nr:MULTISPECIES: c-type cytochrome [Pseudoalteromonas]MCF6436581.1 cytochrome c4 [Pseudoalteromonas sp. MMG022]OHU86075.1 cytochrome C [Pseudoalteromonas sp. JW3]OHU89817.1 cytochrome C [Pseudoalteromonas amylolytica]